MKFLNYLGWSHTWAHLSTSFPPRLEEELNLKLGSSSGCLNRHGVQKELPLGQWILIRSLVVLAYSFQSMQAEAHVHKHYITSPYSVETTHKNAPPRIKALSILLIKSVRSNFLTVHINRKTKLRGQET
eukprot:TRINITY_DN20440_c1_g1_i2.p1 TRINITY_DN20440_c1_g1~~TRINITY_DN20440_c1_g1_i2.p1  ORF type:complete len:129 (-),score=6.59 TRINITY_DN20440_c1_g1_i2:924-1310(-)